MILYGIALILILALALLLVWKLGTVAFVILVLGSLFLLTGQNKTA